ncbi:MAG: glycosyltransferase [Chloroflexi bacterium]|nr:glycosyltransferase [Chloroflexota bacterium]MCC6892480.1 glycosyltransferase [Anaerolineae bacterium]
MRILIGAHGYPPTHSAGAERRAERMAHWLAVQGHEVEVFAIESLSEPGVRLDSSVQDGVLVHRLSYDIEASDNPFRNLYDSPIVGNALRQVLQQTQFDLMHLVSGYLLGGQAIHTVHEAGIPVVLTLTEYWFLCARLNLIQATEALCNGPESAEKCTRCLMESKRRYRLPAQHVPQLMNLLWVGIHKTASASHQLNEVNRRQQVLRTALDAADLVICPSKYLISMFEEYGFDTSRYLFIRQGLAVQGAEGHVRKPATTGVMRIGYVGQIKPHKGVDLLIDAVIGLINAGEIVRLELWGKESEAPEYVDMLKARSSAYPEIRWNGSYTGGKVWEVLSELDTLVVPSRWHENSPNAILEAYKMGVLVVATDLGGMAELVKHDHCGLVFRLNDVDDLRHQLERLLHEKGLAERLRENIPPVKSIDEEMREITEHYRQLLPNLS